MFQQYELDLAPAHAILSASSSHRWIACPASVQAQFGLQDESSPAAAEGTALHELAETCLRNAQEPHEFLGKEVNGHVIDLEQANMARVYVEHCRSLPQAHTYVERRVDFSNWADEGFGTADFLSIDEGEAFVVDAKFGRSLVNANNTQLKCYALGVFDAFGFDRQIDTINMTIVQPRLRHLETHTMRSRELLAWGREVLAPAAKAALGDKPPFNPGESQCRYCRASATCRALAEHIFAKIGEEFA
ncbi:MAG: hypothetical protein CMO61_00070 [Verrucomicrobiales bacterium]|nr:hypothetical protein [Verrucomicrobiales bacterium]|tara:strand:+ start:4264 stop:5001 length:738 start_codon:yes stop_codon:yes gene_type:complete